MTIVKFILSQAWSNPALGMRCYSTRQPDNVEGEYIPLAEVYELKRLLRRVVKLGPALFDDQTFNRPADMYENSQSVELQILLLDCQEALK